MSGLTKKHITWLTEFHQKTAVLDEICNKIRYRDLQEELWNSDSDPDVSKDKITYSLDKFPSYLQPVFREKKACHTLTFHSVYGFAIDMGSNSGLEDYMISQFNKKVRAHQRRAFRRFESSFDLRQERYYGFIEKELCASLLEELKSMIVRRFKQRQQESDTLKNWDSIERTTYKLVLEKKASIFVIYHEQHPVSISISYHYAKLFFYYVTSYDTDYGKFSLGNIMIMKQLEWCYENGYRYFDMGWGDLDYKRRWCNLVYQHHRYFIIPRNSFSNLFKTLIEGCKTTIMGYLLNRGYNKKYHRIKAKLRGTKKSEVISYEGKAGPINKINTTSGELGSKVDPAMHPALSYHIYSFLYSSQEKFKDIQLYQLTSSKFNIRATTYEQIIEIL